MPKLEIRIIEHALGDNQPCLFVDGVPLLHGPRLPLEAARVEADRLRGLLGLLRRYKATIGPDDVEFQAADMHAAMEHVANLLRMAGDRGRVLIVEVH